MRKTTRFITILLTMTVIMGGCRNTNLEETSEGKPESEAQHFSLEAENEEESNLEIIDQFKYEYDENNIISIVLSKNKNSGKISAHAFCHYSEENMGLMQNDFIHIWMYPHSKGIDISAVISVGENSYLYLMNDGKLLINDIPLNPSEDIPNEYIEKFSDMRNNLTEFYKKHEISIE